MRTYKFSPSSRTLRLASVLPQSDNRRICSLLLFAQICPNAQTSHIPNPLSKIARNLNRENLWHINMNPVNKYLLMKPSTKGIIE